MYFISIHTHLIIEEAEKIYCCHTYTLLKRDLLSFIRTEHIILELQKYVTQRNCALWGQFLDLEKGRLNDNMSKSKFCYVP